MASQSPELADNGYALLDPFRPVIEDRLFTAYDSIIDADCEVHPTGRLFYDSLPQEYRDVFNNCRMYLEKHLEFVNYLHHLSLDDFEKKNQPSSERSLGIPVTTEEGDKRKWQCGVVGCQYKGTLQHLVSHLRTRTHIGIRTFACTLDCKILFHHPQDRDRHVREKTCRKSRIVEDAAEPQGSTRLLRGVQDQSAAVPKPKVKSRVNQQLASGKGYRIPTQTSPQSINDPGAKKDVYYDPMLQFPGNPGHYNPGIPSTSFVPPQHFGAPVYLTHAYNQTHSSVPTTQDGRVGMHPPPHTLLTPDLFRPSSILPMNYGGVPANVITSNDHIYGAAGDFQPTSNPQFTRASQPAKPGYNHPSGLTYDQPGLDIRSQDPGRSSTSRFASFTDDLYGYNAPQASYRRPQDSRQTLPYAGVSNGPEALGVTGIMEEDQIKEEEYTRVDSEGGVVAMDVAP